MDGKQTLIIILCTTIPGVAFIAAAVIFWRIARHRKSRLFNRGITPIGDEEIESWRNEKQDEQDKEFEAETPNRKSSSATSQQRQHHQQYDQQEAQQQQQQQLPQQQQQQQSHHHHQTSSVSSMKKPASVIVYRDGARPRPSGEEPPPVSLQMAKRSMDLPQTPVLARAPNSRPGLTDDTVQGDDAYIPQLKRQPSRLTKTQGGGSSSSSPRQSFHRQRNARSNTSTSVPANRDRWYGQNAPDQYQQLASRKSADEIPRSPSHQRFYSTPAVPPRMSYDQASSSSPGGLSPRPVVHQSEIGRAIG